jgi:prepilin-type N-terminal cleavage/methylation domain-containing protein
VNPGPRRRCAPRPAFTLIELLVALALVGLLAALAGPRVVALRGGQSLRGARGEVVATIEAARAAALQRGRDAWVVRRDDTLVAATVDESQAGRVVVATADLHRLYGTTLRTAVPADDSITFDGRGLADPRLDRPLAVYRLQARGSSMRDSVCVTRLGMLLPAGCVP